MSDRDKNLPTKKQRELLNFIDNFIKGSGYAPSYREIMRALDYKSVSTVATHIDGLVSRGFLVKRDGSYRSLEVTTPQNTAAMSSNLERHAWLQQRFETALKNDQLSESDRASLEAARQLLLGEDDA